MQDGEYHLVNKFLDMGADVLWFGSDVEYFMRGLNSLVDGLEKL